MSFLKKEFLKAVAMDKKVGVAILSIKLNLIPESNATILARSAKSVKLDSYEKLQKVKHE